MGKLINTFAQGMDKDSSKTKYDNTHYYDALNFRITTQEGLSSGALEVIDGNFLRFTLVDTNEIINYVVGYVILRDHIILWTTSNNTSIPVSNSLDRIWKIPINSLENLTGNLNYKLSPIYFHLDPKGDLIYEDHLFLCTGNKIQAVGRYENSNIQKVYWVDEYNQLRHLNTVHNDNINDLVNLSPDKLEVISNFDITRPELVGFASGNLRSGKIQYVYQLYVINGGETVFSPTSHLINITESEESATTSENYEGSPLDTNTGKAVRGSIEVKALGYNRIRIVAIHYTTLQGDPTIRVIEEKEVSTLGETITFVDAGQTLMNYTLEQIRILGTLLFIPKTLETKDNILFPANIVEQSFDIDFDARAYRFAGESATSSNYNYNSVVNLRKKSRIYDSQGNSYEGSGSNPIGPWVYYNELGTPVPSKDITGWENIPKDFDAINQFNNITYDGIHEQRFMYQTNGKITGGSGPNVSYKFAIKTIDLDDNSGYDYIRTGLEGTVENPSFNNYASPYQCAKYLGYQRDEVYRFGIVFFDKKGRSSFVKWIGDIRMPSISTKEEMDVYDTGGIATPQKDYVTIKSPNDFKNGYNCIYQVMVNNNVGTTGYWHVYNEQSIEEGMDAIVAAFESAGAIATIDNYYINLTWKTPPPTSGRHTYTIRKYPDIYSIEEAIAGNHFLILDYSTDEVQNYVGTIDGAKQNYSPVYYDTVAEKIKANILYPEFTVNLTGTPAEGLHYQLVRVKRESTDRSIRGQGTVTYTRQEGTSTTRNPEPWNVSAGVKDLVCFASPEVAFNKNIDRQLGDTLQIVGIYNHMQNNGLGQTRIVKYREIQALNNPQTRKSGTTFGDEFNAGEIGNVVEGGIVAMDKTEQIIKNLTYNTGVVDISGTNLKGDKGINFACIIKNSIWRGFDTLETVRPLINYKRNAFLYQYGGNTYESRARNYYMATGKVQILNEAIIPVFDGDTYISYFDYLSIGRKNGEPAADGICEVAVLPLETSINLELRMDACYTSRAHPLVPNLHFMRERKGVYTDDGVLEQSYLQPTDLYLYNTAYSKENTTKVHLIRPFDWLEQTIFDTRVLASVVKTNNELIDSWLKYGVNSYKDVDPQYGEIITLINVNDKLLFFQPKAFGTLSVNERALLQTGNIAQLSLGISGVLERYDYAKTEIGISHKDHIVLSTNGLYWIDVINKSMYSFGGGIEEVSLMKGMDSWFRDNLTLNDKYLLYNDPKYREIYVSKISGDVDKRWNLCYNEITNSFVGFVHGSPTFVINYNDNVLSCVNGYDFYKHNDISSDKASFYNYGTGKEAFVQLIVNPEDNSVVVFNNLEWFTELWNTDRDDIRGTFSSVEFDNDYQSSGDTPIVLSQDSNIKRRIRRWRYTIPRAVTNRKGGVTLDRNDSRYRDTHLFIKLKYETVTNPSYRFITHDIITSYTIANK